MAQQPETADEVKARVRAQYGAAGDAYVKSAGHATGPDLQRMIEEVRPQPADRLLDIATGGGHVARVFAPYVASAVASDLTPEILQHAAASFAADGLSNVHTELADAEALPFPDRSFEIVTCRIAPHHFPNPGTFVAEVARVLVDGGTFALVDSTVPDGNGGVFFNHIEKLRDPSHVRSLSVDEWRRLIEANGLTIGLVETFYKRHDFLDWTTRSRMSDSDRADLARLFLDADAATQEALRVERDGDTLIAFSDTKTLFVADKNAG